MDRFYVPAASSNASSSSTTAAAASATEVSSSSSSSSSSFTSRLAKFRVKHRWRIEDFYTHRHYHQPAETLHSAPFFAWEHGLRFELTACPAGNNRPGSQAVQRVDRHGNLPPDFCLTTAPIVVGAAAAEHDRGPASSHWRAGASVMIEVEANVIMRDGAGMESGHRDMVWLDKFRQKMTGDEVTQRSFNFRLNGDHIGRDGSMELIFEILGLYNPDDFSGIITCQEAPLTCLSNGFTAKMATLLTAAGADSADLTLVVDGQQFAVHSLLLAAHSAVFAAMLGHANTREAIERKVLIEELSAPTVRTLLHYIYTGTIEESPEEQLSLELLSAADRYQVDALKEACERQLSLSLTTDSVLSVLLHADLHDAATLKENCLKYIAFHSSAVMSCTSAAWKRFTVQAPTELIAQVFTRAVAKWASA